MASKDFPPTDLNSTTELTITENQPIGTIGDFNATDPEGGAITYKFANDVESQVWAENTDYELSDVNYQTTNWRLVNKVVPEHNFSTSDVFTYQLDTVVSETNGSLYQADLDFSAIPDWSRYENYFMDQR